MLDRYLRNEATEEEVKLLDQFYQTYQKDQPQTDLQPADFRTKLEILQRINHRIFSERQQRKIPAWLKVAATVTVLAGSLFLFQRPNATHDEPILQARVIKEQTARGQKSQIELPDGSKVYLNSGSAISFPEKFEGTTRPVALEGEAYFEVTQDTAKPFLVQTPNARTEVLGTTFNVNARESKNTAITLVEGKVNVSASSKEIVLLPGEQARIDANRQTISKRKVDVNKYIGWKDNILYFEQTRLVDAVATLENWYNVDITVQSESLEGCLITAKYQNETLENVLKSIQFILRSKVTYQTDSTVTISGKGCK